MSLVGKTIGNYRVERLIGEGGMGSVYLGVHPLIGKRVAIKVLLPELAADTVVVERFFQEAKAVNRIGHPNIVDIVDFGRVHLDGLELVYLIMEYLDGESLAQRMQQGMSQAEVTRTIGQICSALAASHDQGIVHRDLKPENVFLIRRGEDRSFVKVLDFGIAKVKGSHGNKTRTGMVIGTPHYMSPEQCEGLASVDGRSDIYALGVLMYELLTGRVPFGGDGFGEVLVAHLTQAPMPPSALRPVPPGLEAIVLRALEKKPERRFQSMREFEAAVADPERYLSAGPAPVKKRSSAATMNSIVGPRGTTTLSGSASETMSRHRRTGSASGSGAGAWVAVVLVLGLLGGGGYFWYARSSGHTQPAATPPAADPIVEAPPAAPTPPAPVEPPAIPAPAAPAPPADVKISFNSTPSGATVSRPDGEVLGTTPFARSFARGSVVDVAFSLAGMPRQTRSIDTQASREVAIIFTAPPVAHTPRVVAVAPSKKAAPARKPAPSRGKPAGKARPSDPGGLLKTQFD